MSRRVSFAGLICVVAIWCAVFFTPSLRILLCAQATPQWPNFLENGLRDKDLARVVREHPNDAHVRAFEIENGPYPKDYVGGDYRKVQLQKYDQLIAAFPGEEWLLQNRLRLSTSGGFKIDIGEFAPPGYDRVSPTWLSRAEISQALHIAERGARLYPQNSFYDWMRAIFLFGLKQPDNALRALQDGARKPRFDDGILREAQNRLHVRAMQKPLLWEERVGILAAMLLPHFAVMTNVNRAAIRQGARAERNGDHMRSLEIYGTQMKLCAAMRRDSTGLISLLVAEAMTRQAWGGLKRRASELDANEPAQSAREKVRRQTRAQSRSFAAYATHHGRSDLAQFALREASEFDASDLTYAFQPDYFYGGSTTQDVTRIGKFSWVGAVLLRALFAVSIAWLVFSAVSFAVRAKGVLPSPLDVAACAVFTSATFAVLLLTALRLGAAHEDSIWIMVLGGEAEDNNSILAPLKNALLWLPLLLPLFYYLAAAMWRARGSTPAREDQNAPDAIAARAPTPGVFAQLKSGLRWGAIALAVIALCYLTTWWGFWLLSLPNIGLGNEIYLLTIAPPVLGALVFWLWKRRLRLADWPRFFIWSRSTLGILFVTGSVAYLLVALWSLPLRHQADARLDEFIARGEVAVLRDAVVRKATSPR